MALPSFFRDAHTRPPLDPGFYSLEPDEATFFKTLTGIQDDEELKKHIFDVQAKAYEIYGYPCIRHFTFTKLKISRHPTYPKALELARTRSNPILLDMACCFGNDVRKATVDGWPVEGAIASDLEQGFWDAGHQLFKSTPQSFPVNFIRGDVFDPSVLQPREPFYDPPSSSSPDLQSLKSLTPLQGHISAIHASSFFHLFDEEKQLQLAKLMASLLSPTPGSVIFGGHGGLPEKGYRASSTGDHLMFCHSPQSWEELWDGQVFKKGTVQVTAFIKEFEVDDPSISNTNVWHGLIYSVTRL